MQRRSWNTLAAVGCAASLCIAAALAFAQSPRTASRSAATPGTTARSVVAAAHAQARAEDRHLLLFVWRQQDQQTRGLEQRFRAASQKVADRAISMAVHINDPNEQAFIDKLDLKRAPLPLALVLAPNGAVTGAFPQNFAEADLLKSFASPRMAHCLKALQEGRMVFLCVQNEATAENEAALAGVKAFRADPKYGEAVEIVLLDPADAAEAGFLKELQVDPQSSIATTMFIAPPGRPVAKLTGATSKEQLVAALEKAGCGHPGCTHEGCNHQHHHPKQK